MSTSKLQIAVGNMLDKTFPEFTIRENYRPDWLISSNLTRLELDFYIEELKIAFEIQGDQHFQYIPFFHNSPSDFDKRKRYDQEKKDLCYGANVKLIEICTLMDAVVAIKTMPGNIAIKSDIEIVCPGPSHRSLNRKQIWHNEGTAIGKYARSQLYKYSFIEDFVLIDDNKISEIRKFYSKLLRFYKHGHKTSELPSFSFQFLNIAEQEALFEEINNAKRGR